MAKSGAAKRKQQQGLPKAKRQKQVRTPKGQQTDASESEEEVVATPYEYEEPMPEEELKKNRRYDDVDVYEYELPEDFEDEEIDEDAAFTEEDKVKFGNLFKEEAGSELSEEEANADVDLNSEDEESEGSEEYNVDDFSEEEAEALENEQKEDDNESEKIDDESERESENEERHQRMLEAVTGGERSKAKPRRGQVVLSEAVPESEYSLNPAGGGSRISVADLMGSLEGSAGNLGALKKRLERVETGAGPVSAPLPRVIKERIERQAGYEHTKEDIAKWQPLVKANREAPTIVFSSDKKGVVPQLSTAGMSAKFVPTTDLEKEISELLKESGVADGKTVEAAEALELNKLTVEEVLARKERLAKMRSLLFQHEAKAKRVKKIKSKAFHRAQAKTRAKERAQNGSELIDKEAAREEALKEEFKRAQERMTLKHRNTSKWAKRALKRGMNLHAAEDGTREAIAEQLRMHAALTRKVDRMDDRSSSDESSSEGEDDVTADMEEAEGLRLKREIARDEAAVLNLLEGDTEEEQPRKGLFALPFMARALDRKRQEARSEAMAVLEEIEQRQENGGTAGTTAGSDDPPAGTSGRMVFGASAEKATAGNEDEEPFEQSDSDMEERLDSEEEIAGQEIDGRKERMGKGRKAKGKREENVHVEFPEEGDQLAQVGISGGFRAATEGPLSVDEEPLEAMEGAADVSTRAEIEAADVSMKGADVSTKGAGISMEGASAHGWLFQRQGVDDRDDETIVQEMKTSRMPVREVKTKQANGFVEATSNGEARHENGHANGMFLEEDEENNNEDEIVGGDAVQTELSQVELVRRAFAGDDVEADFDARKSEMLDEEVPAIEGPVTLPGWGQWTGVQKKKGLPGWILQEQQENEKKRGQAMAKRQDAGRKHVIISEKWDKKAAKYGADGVPFPFKDKEAFERSLRNPLGREYNTDSAHRNLIRPAVIKNTGVIIDPIKYVKPEQKGKGGVPTGKKGKSKGGKGGKAAQKTHG